MTPVVITPCKMCGSETHRMQYDIRSNSLKVICGRCSFVWYQPTLETMQEQMRRKTQESLQGNHGGRG